MRCRPHKHWRHHDRKQGATAEANAALARRRRRGHWSWWWIPAIVLGCLWLNGRGPFHRWDRWDQHEERVVREVRRAVPRESRVVLVHGRPAGVLEVKLSVEKCGQRDISAENLSAGMLTLIDALAKQKHDPADEPRHDKRLLAELGKTIVRNEDDRAVELREVARLSRRGAGVQVPAAVRLYVSGSSGDGQRLLAQVESELDDVAEAREEEGQATFQIDSGDGWLLINLASAHEPMIAVGPGPLTPPAVPEAPAAPTAPAAPVAPVPPAQPLPPQPPVKGIVDDLVDIAVGSALGDDADVEQAIKRAKQRAGHTAKEAIAQATAKIKGETTQASDEKQRAFATAEIKVAIAPVATTKPGWVDSPPPQIGENGTITLTGSTGALFGSRQEAQRALAETVNEMTASFIDLVLGPGASNRVSPAEFRKLPTEVWTGEVQRDSGLTFYESHALLTFDAHDQRDLWRRWRRLQSERQVRYAAIAGGSVLALLATLLGYLKLDTATRGYYTGRLRVAAGAVALLVIGVAGTVMAHNAGVLPSAADSVVNVAIEHVP